MSIWNGDASEFYALAGDFAKVGASAVGPMRQVMSDAGETLADEWRNNATATSGVHGKHYPASIDSELILSATSIAVDAGPNAGRPQGGMGRGFEFGSMNQPPHLDGLRALETVAPRVDRMVDAAMGFLFP